jgi:hypothetical protein
MDKGPARKDARASPSPLMMRGPVSTGPSRL